MTRAIFQSFIDEYYGYFIDWVCEQRGMDRQQLLALADGRIYTATQAVANGLADQVGDYDDCLNALLDAVGGEPEVEDFQPSIPVNWRSLLGSSKSGEIDSLLHLLPPTGALAYYGN